MDIRKEIVEIVRAEGERRGSYITAWVIALHLLKNKTNCRYYVRLTHRRKKDKRASFLDTLSKAEMQLLYLLIKERFK
jgi:hypothetical protein